MLPALLRAQDPLAASTRFPGRPTPRPRRTAGPPGGGADGGRGQAAAVPERRPGAEAVIRPALYHRLKAVAHVPLALHLLLSGPVRGPDGLRGLRALVAGRPGRAGRTGARPRPGAGRSGSWTPASGCWTSGLRPGGLAAGSAGGLHRGAWVPCSWPTSTRRRAWNWTPWTGRWRPVPRAMAPGEWRGPAGGDRRSHMAREGGDQPCSTSAALLGEPGEGTGSSSPRACGNPRTPWTCWPPTGWTGRPGRPFSGIPCACTGTSWPTAPRPGWTWLTSASPGALTNLTIIH